VTREGTFTPGRDLQLLPPLLQVHLRGHSVSTLYMDGGMFGQVGNEMTFPKLVYSLLYRDHLKGTETVQLQIPACRGHPDMCY
jgi:hypothetical protein